MWFYIHKCVHIYTHTGRERERETIHLSLWSKTCSYLWLSTYPYDEVLGIIIHPMHLKWHSLLCKMIIMGKAEGTKGKGRQTANKLDRQYIRLSREEAISKHIKSPQQRGMIHCLQVNDCRDDNKGDTGYRSLRPSTQVLPCPNSVWA